MLAKEVAKEAAVADVQSVLDRINQTKTIKLGTKKKRNSIQTTSHSSSTKTPTTKKTKTTTRKNTNSVSSLTGPGGVVLQEEQHQRDIFSSIQYEIEDLEMEQAEANRERNAEAEENEEPEPFADWMTREEGGKGALEESGGAEESDEAEEDLVEDETVGNETEGETEGGAEDGEGVEREAKEGLTEYEATRRRTINSNLAQLKNLQVLQAKQALMPELQEKQKKKKKRKRQPKGAPPSRASPRLQVVAETGVPASEPVAKGAPPVAKGAFTESSCTTMGPDDLAMLNSFRSTPLASRVKLRVGPSSTRATQETPPRTPKGQGGKAAAVTPSPKSQKAYNSYHKT